MKSVILHRHSLISILICISLIGGQSFAQTCTFTGGGNGTSWTQGSNWSCGSEPDPSSQNVVIPVGFNVINNGTSDFGFENGYDLTINGSLDMNNKKIEMKSSGSFLTIGPSGNLFDINELFFNSNADGLINGALDVNHLKTDDDTELTVNTRCIDVTNKLENLSSSGILGSGCIDYTGSSGDFANSGSDGIFGCTDNNVNNCSLDGGALPVELVRFIVSADDDFVALEWTTASEENFDYFSIERSEDGEGFYEIGTVAGHGDSQTPINYSFEDIDPIFGISYYRLNAIDYDGSYEKFETKSVEFVPEELKVSIYPNPSEGGNFKIKLGTPKQLNLQNFTLHNINGTQIIQRILKIGTNEISLPHVLNQGIYIAKIQIDNYITTRRLVVN